MKYTYPIVMSKSNDGYFVPIPDFNIATQENDFDEAIFMARDAIGIMGITLEDDGEELPKPNSSVITKERETDIISQVEVDFKQYRKKYESIR